MKFKIKIMIIVSFLAIVSMSFFIVHNNSVSVSSIQPDNVITGSNNSYLITLKGVPSGNGTYQQLITLNNYSKYGINDNGSNIEFFDYSNYTHLYAWIQSINATSMQVWIKNYNDSSKIDMQILSKFENLFNVNGYLGDAPNLSLTYGEYFNAPKVFGNSTSPNALDFKNGSLPNNFVAALNSGSYTISDGFYTTTTSSNAEVIYYNISIENPYAILYGFTSSFHTPTGNTGNNYLVFGSQANNQYQADFANVPGSAYLTYPVSGNYNTISPVSVPNPNVQSLMVRGNLTTTFLYYNDSLINSYKSNFFPAGNEPFLTSNYEAGVSSPTISYFIFMNYPNSNMPTFTIVSLYHSVDFKLLGSPFSSLWNIMVNGTTYQADSSNIYLNMTNGYYNIIVNLPAGYSAITKGVLYVNGTNQVYKIFVSYNNNSGFSNDIIYAIILASIIVAVAIYFSKRS